MDDFYKLINELSGWADLQQVSHSDASGSHSVVRKQLKNVGCPLWKSYNDHPAMTRRAGSGTTIPTIPMSSFRCRMFTKDDGSDMAAMGKGMKLETCDVPDEVELANSCKEHQGHLISKSGLVAINMWLARVGAKFQYYSSLAKLVHVWRHNAKLIFFVWAIRFGTVSATELAMALPPSCSADRWGNIHIVKKFLTAAGLDKVFFVVADVIEKKI